MKLIRLSLSFLVMTCIIALNIPSAPAAEPVKLEPNAKLVFEFPELPETFFAQSTADKHSARLTAQLPENYSPQGKFPIFVFLSGGSGGPGDCGAARSIVGPRDFISVGMPLFKDKPVERPSPLPGIKIDVTKIITKDDGELLAKSYGVMLSKLFEAVPNITAERSTIGGFSNGGHAAAALITAKDPFVRQHFTAFVFYEGGMALALEPQALAQPELKRARFLMLLGDTGDQPGRKLVEPLVAAMKEWAAKSDVDFTYVVMHGYGHTMPPEYTKLAGNWVRGEKLPEIPSK